MPLNFRGSASIEIKSAYTDKAITVAENCSAVCIHAAEDAENAIPIGSNVLRGTLIGSTNSTPVYSSIAGTFNGILEIEGENYFVVVNNGTSGEEAPMEPESRPLTALSKEDIIESAHVFGIIDSRTGFPLWQLLEKATNCKRVVIDCTESFPHSAIAHRICSEQARFVVGGAKVLIHAVGAVKCVFAAEKSKKASFKALEKFADDEKLFAMAALKEKYPFGDRALMDALYVVELGKNETALDKGVLIVGAETVAALYNAMVSGKPQTQRYISVCGEGIKNGGNFCVPRGITLHDISALCGEFPDDCLIIENSLLSGKPIGGAINDTTVSLIAAKMKKKPTGQCISCGKCISACPVKLNPSDILLKKSGNLNKLCIACGACEFVCPGGIPLLKLIKNKDVAK